MRPAQPCLSTFTLGKDVLKLVQLNLQLSSRCVPAQGGHLPEPQTQAMSW